MQTTLIKYLEQEKILLMKMVDLSQTQKEALIKFDMNALEKINLNQFEISRELRQMEELRINLLVSWLGIKKHDAQKIKMTELIEFLKLEQNSELKKLNLDFKDLSKKLAEMNSFNRVLTVRARNTVNELMNYLTNGTSQLCNVKV